MSGYLIKGIKPVAGFLAPYLPYLPRPVLTLLPTTIFHYTTTPHPTPLSLLVDPLTHPLHAPLLFVSCLIPLLYTLGLISGNISWVDRSWPFFTPLCSTLICLWACQNPSASVYGHNLPRLACMLLLQYIWSARLLSHAIRREFYDLTSEDYRYAQFRKLVPGWLFQLVHLFVVEMYIAIAQPLLLFSLSLPLHSAMVLPPAELSAGPLAIAIPFSAISPLIPARYHTAPPTTPVLNLYDVMLVAVALALITVEGIADNQMYAFQSSKHSSKSSDVIVPTRKGSTLRGSPAPAAYPRSHHPGFITTGLFRYARHPNFACEQLFWLVQALFVVSAGESSGVTRSGWVGGAVFGPCFALSVLFCASTTLTEWITQSKYPLYRSYRQLVGQFLPQETLIVTLWSMLRGKRRALERDVFGPPAARSSRKGDAVS